MFQCEIGLDRREEAALIASGTTACYGKGDIIFAAGQHAGELHYIKNGWVNVFRINDQGRQVSIGLRYRGEFAGLGSFACSQERGCYGQAMMDSEIVIVSREKFNTILQEVPTISAKLISLLGSRLRDTQNSIVHFISHQTDKRLNSILLNIACYLGREDGDRRLIHLKLSQEELAHLVGCSRQTVNALLVELKSAGCLEMKGREIVAIWPERLMDKL